MAQCDGGRVSRRKLAEKGDPPTSLVAPFCRTLGTKTSRFARLDDVIDRKRVPAANAEVASSITTEVETDPRQPTAEVKLLDPFLWPAAQCAIRADERVLGEILRVGSTGDQATTDREHQVLVMLDERRERAVDVTREAGRAFRAHSQ